MQSQEADVAMRNHDYQVEFARTLIDTLGLDEAIDICARNCWAGIGAVVVSEQRRRAH